KSTLAWSIIGLVPPPGRIVDGSIIIDGVDITKMSEAEIREKVRWKKVSMIFQGAMNALNPVYKIREQVAEPMILAGYSEQEAYKRVDELLEAVGLTPAVGDRYPHELSGGMKQRVVIAMALTLEPDLVIADEPTTALDVVVQAQILNLLKELQRKKKRSIIIISHDLGAVTELAEKIAVMYAGKIVEFGTAEQVFNNPLHPYTQALIRAIPRLTGPVTKLEYIPGAPPDLRFPPPGCRFAPRCSKVMDICHKEEPPMKELEKGHFVACHLYD
ncbi:MAG: ABC transporter ATP-binding protein, partial [Desulfurococcales archaeon]|nr:ABC transporter ATP-binding protein [Desulfurococcales archaeon]